MGLPKLKTKISVANFLESEKVSQVKHEYIDGEIYAIVGTGKNHNRIIKNGLEKLEYICKEAIVKLFDERLYIGVIMMVTPKLDVSVGVKYCGTITKITSTRIEL